MGYINRIRDAYREVRAAQAAMAADEDRRHRDGVPFVEDDVFRALQDRAARADEQFRAGMWP